MKVLTAVIIFFLSFILTAGANDWNWEYNLWMEEISEEYSVCPHLVLAVIEIESNFKNSSVSPAGAVGFMQLMPETARMLNIDDPSDPIENLRGGIKYLAMMKKQFNRNIPLALAAYNAGPTVVGRYKSIPPFGETRRFVFRVLERYTYYKDRGNASVIFDVTP